jgi:NAD(P)-dependent dehydrogenase (short-subunit alcohol dehydrogenase family)
MAALYRADPRDGVAWITGASTGIGRSLARDLVLEGYTVAVTSRDEERLATLVTETAGMPGKVMPFICDVTDDIGMRKTVAEIERQAGPIVLAVFNAGTYLPTRGERLDALNIISTFDINLFGVLHGLAPVTDRMRARGRGQVVLVGSASSFFGWPSAGAYGASKAALNNLAEALKHDFDKMNIRLQVINPGFIDTPLTGRYSFFKPALMPVDSASRRMAHAFRRGGFETSFPRRFTWPMKLLRMLPFGLRFWMIHKITGWKSRPMAAARKPRD